MVVELKRLALTASRWSANFVFRLFESWEQNGVCRGKTRVSSTSSTNKDLSVFMMNAPLVSQRGGGRGARAPLLGGRFGYSAAGSVAPVAVASTVVASGSM